MPGVSGICLKTRYDEAKAAQAMNEAERIRIESILRIMF